MTKIIIIYQKNSLSLQLDCYIQTTTHRIKKEPRFHSAMTRLFNLINLIIKQSKLMVPWVLGVDIFNIIGRF
jgi:hypothetical protein